MGWASCGRRLLKRSTLSRVVGHEYMIMSRGVHPGLQIGFGSSVSRQFQIGSVFNTSRL